MCVIRSRAVGAAYLPCVLLNQRKVKQRCWKCGENVKRNADPSDSAREERLQVSLCRPGSGGWLAAEIEAAEDTAGVALRPPLGSAPSGEASDAGWVVWDAGAGTGWDAGWDTGDGIHLDAFMFERQRLPDARWVPGVDTAPLAEMVTAGVAPIAARLSKPPVLHLFAPEGPGAEQARRKLRAFGPALHKAWEAHPATSGKALRAFAAAPERGATGGGALGVGREAGAPSYGVASGFASDTTVLQVCLLDAGAWSALTPAAELLHPYPGGVAALSLPEGSPSRSALKLLEAWQVLGQRPGPRQTVVDLGAAPGGWSRLCLERGCRVLAVDNGPLKIAGLDELPGRLEHHREDGLRYRPPAALTPADWMLSDMLVAPGVCLGLLRKWLVQGWARHLVVNVKLPQREPLVALAPLREFLAGVPGLRVQIRQLFHDRREVTVLAWFPGGIVGSTKRAPAVAGQKAPLKPHTRWTSSVKPSAAGGKPRPAGGKPRPSKSVGRPGRRGGPKPPGSAKKRPPAQGGGRRKP